MGGHGECNNDNGCWRVEDIVNILEVVPRILELLGTILFTVAPSLPKFQDNSIQGPSASVAASRPPSISQT